MADETTTPEPQEENKPPGEVQTPSPDDTTPPLDAEETPSAEASAPPDTGPEGAGAIAAAAESNVDDLPGQDAASASLGDSIEQAEIDALTTQLNEDSDGPAQQESESPASPGNALDPSDSEAPSAPPDASAPDDSADGPAARTDTAKSATEVSNATSAAGTIANSPESTGEKGPEPSVFGNTPVAVSASDAKDYAEPELSATEPPTVTTIDMLDDVELDMKIELGRTEMNIEEVLRLGLGSVLELDKLAGDPVDVYVSERLIARGEVLVLNDNFCVRLNDIHSPIPELDNG